MEHNKFFFVFLITAEGSEKEPEDGKTGGRRDSAGRDCKIISGTRRREKVSEKKADSGNDRGRYRSRVGSKQTSRNERQRDGDRSKRSKEVSRDKKVKDIAEKAKQKIESKKLKEVSKEKRVKDIVAKAKKRIADVKKLEEVDSMQFRVECIKDVGKEKETQSEMDKSIEYLAVKGLDTGGEADQKGVGNEGKGQNSDGTGETVKDDQGTVDKESKDRDDNSKVRATEDEGTHDEKNKSSEKNDAEESEKFSRTEEKSAVEGKTVEMHHSLDQLFEEGLGDMEDEVEMEVENPTVENETDRGMKPTKPISNHPDSVLEEEFNQFIMKSGNEDNTGIIGKLLFTKKLLMKNVFITYTVKKL